MMRCVFVVLLTRVATATFDYSGRATLEDVNAFFNTTDKILLIKRSYSRVVRDDDPTCIYSKTTAVKDTEISLTEHYDYHEGSKLYCGQYRVYMKMSKEQGMDVAPVLTAAKVIVPSCPLPPNHVASGARTHNDGYKKGRKYTFQYYDRNASCAVITFADIECDIKCELHVWESANAKQSDMTNCLREYGYLCKHRTAYEPYQKGPCAWNNEHYVKKEMFIPYQGNAQ